MKIPILDLKKQIAPIRRELDRAIKAVIDNTDFILGREVMAFEQDAAKYIRIKYAVGVSNGTDAIRLSLTALGIKPGDAVACPSFTYYATAGAIVSMGAIPVFCDICPDTYNISAQSLEGVLRKNKKPKIKAVIPVHLFGQCADMDSVLRAAQRCGLKVIEDTAQAFGAEYKGKMAGSMGNCSAVSFFPGKNLGAFGDAGLVLTGNKRLAGDLMVLRNQGNKERYHHIYAGYNNRLDTLQAAVLRVKLRYLDAWNKKRQENADYFNRKLKGLPLKTPYLLNGATHIYHQYVLRLREKSKKLIVYLRDKGIDARVYYPVPLHLQGCFRDLGYKKGDFPESEEACAHTLAIPVYPDLTREEKDYIIQCIKDYFSKG